MTSDSTTHIDLVTAAMRLGISYSAAHRLLILGRIRGWKHGSRWVVDGHSLEDMQEE